MSVRLVADLTVPFSAGEGERLIVLGDQHGEIRLMRKLMEAIDKGERLRLGTRVVFLGDLIDRGPASLACLDLAIEAKQALGADCVVGIAGNHEEMLFSAIFGANQEIRSAAAGCWAQNGGVAVLKELGMPKSTDSVRLALGTARLAWLHELRTSHRSGDFLFVHAGINPRMGADQFDQPVGVDLSGEFDEVTSTRWIREPFQRHDPGKAGWFGAFVVHGHDPDDGRRPYATNVARSRQNLDGGSNRTGRSRMAVIEGRRIIVYEADR